MQREYWNLYNSPNKVILSNLTARKLYEKFQSIPSQEYGHWFVCRANDDQWVPLYKKISEISKLVSQVDDLQSVDLGEYIDDAMKTTTGVATKKKHDPSDEKRRVQRVDAKVPVLIDVGLQILECTSLNISVLAIKIDQRFPLELRNKFYPVVIKRKPSLLLRGKPLIREKDHLRGGWNILDIDPSYHLDELVKFLGVSKS
jgi:hypothetical protein